MRDDPYWSHIAEAYEAVSIFDGPEVFLHGFRQLSGWIGDLLAADWFLYEFSIGGFVQVSLSSAGVLAPEAAAAFRNMGLPAVAALVDRFIATFGSEYPRTEDKRYHLLDAHSPFDWDTRDWNIWECDVFRGIETELYRLGDPDLSKIYNTMDAYARTNFAA